ncbi:MAG: hypothetical protein ACOYJ6_13850 [Caulobacterales bacterium]
MNAVCAATALNAAAAPDAAGRDLLARAAQNLNLSARGYPRTLRVARTIADLNAADGVARRHIPEALRFRRQWAGAWPALPASPAARAKVADVVSPD